MIKQWLIFFMILSSIKGTAQVGAGVINNNWSMAALIAADVIMKLEKSKVRDLIEEVKDATRSEKDIADKGSVKALTGSKSTMVTLGAVILTVEFVEEEVKLCLERANQIKRGTWFGKHDIDTIIKELEREQKYLAKIKTDMIFLAGGIKFGGGLGYAYTAAQKIMLRLVPIRRNITRLKKKVDNKYTFEHYFFSKKPYKTK